MKLQDVILKAMAKKITWMEAAEIAGVTDRTMRRIRQRYQDFGYNGLFDQRRGKRSVHRVPMETAEKVLALYQEKYFDLNVRALLGETARRACHPSELHLGVPGAGGSEFGAAAEKASTAPATTAAKATGRNAAAYRWK